MNKEQGAAVSRVHLYVALALVLLGCIVAVWDYVHLGPSPQSGFNLRGAVLMIYGVLVGVFYGGVLASFIAFKIRANVTGKKQPHARWLYVIATAVVVIFVAYMRA